DSDESVHRALDPASVKTPSKARYYRKTLDFPHARPEGRAYFTPLVARTSRPSALANALASTVRRTGTVPKAICRAECSAPYIFALAESSGLRLPPERSMPANTPFDREYASICAVSCASVAADVVRPIGPAAIDASAPSVTLLPSSLSAPPRFMTTSTRSVDDAATW